MFRTGPLSFIRIFLLCKQQSYMSYTFPDILQAGSGRNYRSVLMMDRRILRNSRVLFKKWIWEVIASCWFYYKNFNSTYAEFFFLHVAYSKLNAARVVSVYLGIGCAACMYMRLNLSSAGTLRCVFVLKGQFRINDILLCFRIVGNCVMTQRAIPKPFNLSVPSPRHGHLY